MAIAGYTWTRRPGLAPAVLNAALTTSPLPRTLARTKHSFWVLDYEFAPYGRYRVKYVSRPWKNRLLRTAHLYPPHTPYWEDTRHAAGRRNSVWFIFTGGDHAGLGRLVRARGYARFLDPEEKLGPIIRRAAEIGEEEGEAGFWEAQSALCEAIHLLLQAAPEEEETYTLPGDQPLSSALSFAREVDEFLRTRLADKVSLDEIAAHVHVSTSFLSHRYKSATGRSPMTALTNLRLGHAKTLLLKGYPLKAIAAQLGFADAFHFSKTFKRVEGIPPREFVSSLRRAK